MCLIILGDDLPISCLKRAVERLLSFVAAEEDEISRQAEMQAKNMPLSTVRLSFRAYLLDGTGMCTRVLPPVISNPIYDSSMWII